MLTGILSRIKPAMVFVAIAFLCWGRLLFLKGIWWDDWEWTWHYFGSSNIAEFIQPFISIRHPFDGLIIFYNMRLFEILPLQTTGIWNIWKFIMFSGNAIILYLILKSILRRDSILPITTLVVYLTSPLINNLCLTELGRRIYLFFFLLSILLSIKAVKQDDGIFYYIGAILCGAISMEGLESFVFFDFTRPAIIFYMLTKIKKQHFVKTLKESLFHYLPFFLIGILILLYNVGILKARSGAYAHAYDFHYSTSLAYFFNFIHHYLITVCYMLFGNIRYFLIDMQINSLNFFILSVAFLSAALAIRVIYIQESKQMVIETGTKQALCEEAKVMMFYGICVILLGLFPYIIVHGIVNFGIGSRHLLIASVGASLSISAAVLWLYYKNIALRIFCYSTLGVLVFLNVMHCNLAVKAYHDDWRQQCVFWGKFTSRVPDLNDGTYLIVDMPRDQSAYFGSWRGSYEFAAPLNILYAKARTKEALNIHFAESLKNALDPRIEWSYAANKDKVEGQYMSSKGLQKYYPKKLVLVSYRNGALCLNSETRMAGISGFSADQILDDENKGYPLRWIIK